MVQWLGALVLLNSLLPHGSSQPSVILVPEDAMPSSGLSEQCMYMVHSQTDSHTHKIKINIISKRKKVICVLFPSCEPSELQDVCMMCSV